MREEIIAKYGYYNLELEKYILLIESNIDTEKTTKTESHHVFLRSIFGNNNITVNLSVYEHLLAHYYLYESYKQLSDELKNKKWMKCISSAVTSFQQVSPHRKKKLNELSEYDLLEMASFREEISQINRELFSGENNPAKRPEVREKISKAKKGQKKTEEQNKRWSEYLLEYYKTEAGKNSIEKGTEKRKGLKRSDEQKQNASDAWSEEMREQASVRMTEFYSDEENKNKIFTPEFREAIALRRRGKKDSEELKKKKSNGMSKWCEENSDKVKERNNKTNKDPEKIKKTADKHRGMKRSEESKRLMSEKAKGRFEGKSANNKGLKVFFNPTNPDEITQCLLEDAPAGWERGNPKSRNKTTYKCPTTGKKKRFSKEESPPEGWIKVSGDKND